MDVDKYHGLVMDFQNLMSCIQCHEDSTNIPIILETLNTIADICTNEDCGKDAFREEGGLDFFMELVSTTDSTVILEHALNTLALVVVENVHSQMHLTKREFFLHFHAIIKRSTFPPAVLKNTLLLLSSLLFQNSLAQNLLAENEFFQDIISIYENSAPLYVQNSCGQSVSCDSSVEIFLSVNSVLCFAINNPQNERNQVACSVLFPLTLKLLENSPDVSINSAVSSFLSLCVANNGKVQEKFADCDGLLALKRCFQKLYDSVESDLREFNDVVSKCTLQSLNNLIGIITATVCENGKNAALLGKFGVLTMMIKLLFTGLSDDQLQIRIMLALAYCIDAHSSCRIYLLQTDDLNTFLKRNFQKENQEVAAASKYLLQVCLNSKDDSSEKDLNVLQPENSASCCSDRLNNNKQRANFHKSIGRKNVFKKPHSTITSSKLSTCSTSRRETKSKAVDLISERVPLSTKSNRQLLKRKRAYPGSEVSILSDKSKWSPHEFLAFKSDPTTQINVSDFCRDRAMCKKLHNNDSVSVMKYKNSKQENFTLLNDSKQNKLEYCETASRESSESTSSVDVLSDYKSKAFFNKQSKTRNSPCRLTAKNLSVLDAEGGKNSVHKQECRTVLSEKTNFDQSLIRCVSGFRDRLDFSRNSQVGNETFGRSLDNIDSRNLTSDSSDDGVSPPPPLKSSKLKGFSVHRSKSNDENNDVEFRPRSSQKFNQRSNSAPKFGGLFDFSAPSEPEACRADDFSRCSKKKGVKRKVSSDTKVEKFDSEISGFPVNEFENYVQVLTFPGESCEQHKLISSFEMLRVIPLEEEK